MVREVAVIELCGKAGGIGAVPAVTAHDCTGKSGIAGCTNKKRNGVKEAGIIQQICAACNGLCRLRRVVCIGGHALADVGDLNAVSLAVFNKGVLQTVGVVIVFCVDDGHLGKALVFCKQCRHLALVRVNEAVAENRIAF